MALVLTSEHFERAREAIRQRRAELEAVHAAELQKLDDELSEIDKLEEAARALVEKHSGPVKQLALMSPGVATEAAPPLTLPAPAVVPPPRTVWSDKDMVLVSLEELDSNGQGATRVDISRYIQKAYKRIVPDNSITTYLNRLKHDGRAEFNGQKWHATL